MTVREVTNWLPRADEPLIDPKTGRATRRFRLFLHELAEVRLGGVAGVTIPQVSTAATTAATTATAAQATADSTLTYAQQVAAYSGEVREQSEALRVVAVDNALTGAGDVPPDPGGPPSYVP